MYDDAIPKGRKHWVRQPKKNRRWEGSRKLRMWKSNLVSITENHPHSLKPCLMLSGGQSENIIWLVYTEWCLWGAPSCRYMTKTSEHGQGRCQESHIPMPVLGKNILIRGKEAILLHYMDTGIFQVPHFWRYFKRDHRRHSQLTDTMTK